MRAMNALALKLLTLLMLMLVGPAVARAQEFKLATVAPEGSSWMREIRAAAADIKSRTDGRVTIKVYGGGVMGNEKQVLRKMRIGQLHGGAFTANGLAERYADLEVYGLPLLFRSHAEVDYVRARMDGILAKGLENAGLVSFGITGGGFVRILAGRPITQTADLRGFKIWVPEGDPVSLAAMVALQLAPVTLPVTDVLTGLQTGLVDIIAAPPAAAIALQWHTRVKYVTDVPLMYTMGIMAVDAKAFARLSSADQQVFRTVMSTAYTRLDRQSTLDDAAAQKALQAAGIKQVTAKPDDVAAWRRASDASNRQLAARGTFSAALFEQLERHLQEFRAALAANRPLAAGS
jgi:TRAP-type C4-dicarboxylate transport system substrate-binding protein